jgi:hypothetical protein
MKRNGRTKPLVLRMETLQSLDGSGLRAAAGGVRIWRPLGIAENTDPLYSWDDDTIR